MCVCVCVERRGIDFVEESWTKRMSVVPLNCPLHALVADEEGDGPVKELRLGPAVDVEDGSVSGTGERTLTVVGNSVGNDALLWWRA